MKFKKIGTVALASITASCCLYNNYKSNSVQENIVADPLGSILTMPSNDSTNFTAFDKTTIIGPNDGLSPEMATITGSDFYDDDLKSYIDSHSGAYIDTIDDYLYYQNYNNPIENNDDFRNAFNIEFDKEQFENAITSCYVRVYLNCDDDIQLSFLCKLNSINRLYNYKTLASANNYSLDSWFGIDATTIRVASTRIRYVEYLGNEYIEGNDYVYYVNIDNPVDFSTIKKSIVAIDETDGDITSSIEYSHSYPINLSELEVQEYPVAGTVSDSSGNSVNFNFKISVVDTTKPVIGTTSTSISNTTRLSNDDILEAASISDNYYYNTALDISISDLDNYENSGKKAGQYRFKISVKDPSNNTTEQIFTLNVSDVIKPVYYSIDNSLVNLDNNIMRIKISSETKMDYKYVKGLLKAYDETDGYITALIEVDAENSTYIGNEMKANKNPYTLIFNVSDNAGNTSKLDLKVYVDDDIPPLLFFNGNLYITVNTKVSAANVANLVLTTYNLPSTSYKVEVESDYFGNEDQVGKYDTTCTVYTRGTNEKVSDISMDIIVLNEDGTITDEDLKPKDKSIFERILDFFKKILKMLSEFFEKLYEKLFK